MKTQFKNHIKFGSCWYDNFFKINNRQIIKEKIKLTVEIEDKKSLTVKNEIKNELKRK